MAGASEHTFLFADLVGFTALTEAEGDEVAADVVAEFRGRVRVALSECRGEEVKAIGDAVLIRCPDAGDAVRLGVRIAEDISRLSNYPGVRVGMHTGSAVERGGDWFGTAVNLAARVAAVAGEGQVLISAATRDSAGAIEGIRVRAHGTERLRNVARGVALFEARAASEYELARRNGAQPEPRAVAEVLALLVGEQVWGCLPS